MKVYYDKDIDLCVLDGKTVATIDYGSRRSGRRLNAKSSC